jgi:hypothetical protein
MARARRTDSCSLLLGRWPLMLGTNPVGYMPLQQTNSFLPFIFPCTFVGDAAQLYARVCDAFYQRLRRVWLCA